MNFKKIARILMFSSLVGALSIKGHETVVNSFEASYSFAHRNKLENFVLLLSIIELEEESIMESNASGFVFKQTKDEVFIITADHFCNPHHFGKVDITSITGFEGERKFAAFNQNFERYIKVAYYDKENDICVMKGPSLPTDSFKEIKIAKSMPDIGDKIYNAAAPHGLSFPEVVLLFDGYFGGCKGLYEGCLFTIPAAPGSSGSAVYNSKGEVISIVVATLEDFKNISIGPHPSMLKGIMEYESNN